MLIVFFFYYFNCTICLLRKRFCVLGIGVDLNKLFVFISTDKYTTLSYTENIKKNSLISLAMIISCCSSAYRLKYIMHLEVECFSAKLQFRVQNPNWGESGSQFFKNF